MDAAAPAAVGHLDGQGRRGTFARERSTTMMRAALALCLAASACAQLEEVDVSQALRDLVDGGLEVLRRGLDVVERVRDARAHARGLELVGVRRERLDGVVERRDVRLEGVRA